MPFEAKKGWEYFNIQNVLYDIDKKEESESLTFSRLEDLNISINVVTFLHLNKVECNPTQRKCKLFI